MVGGEVEVHRGPLSRIHRTWPARACSSTCSRAGGLIATAQSARSAPICTCPGPARHRPHGLACGDGPDPRRLVAQALRQDRDARAGRRPAAGAAGRCGTSSTAASATAAAGRPRSRTWPRRSTTCDELDAPLDLDRVSVARPLRRRAPGAVGGRSAEAAPRVRRAAIDGEPRVRLQRVISQAGVCDLEGAYRDWHGGAVRALMGGGPEELPERYAAGDPIASVPLEMPVLLVHGLLDETVSVRLSRTYARSRAGCGRRGGARGDRGPGRSPPCAHRPAGGGLGGGHAAGSRSPPGGAASDAARRSRSAPARPAGARRSRTRPCRHTRGPGPRPSPRCRDAPRARRRRSSTGSWRR